MTTDLDALMDGTLAEVEAAPDYVNPPTGQYNVSIVEVKMEQFEKNVYGDDRKPTGEKEDAVRIRLTRSVDSIIELADAKSIPPADGSLYSENFMYDDKGLARFKRDAAKWLGYDSSELDQLSLRDLFLVLEESEPKACLIKTTENDAGFMNSNTTVLAV